MKWKEYRILLFIYIWNFLLWYVGMFLVRFWPMFTKKSLKLFTIDFWSLIIFPSFMIALISFSLFLVLQIISFMVAHVFLILVLFSSVFHCNSPAFQLFVQADIKWYTNAPYHRPCVRGFPSLTGSFPSLRASDSESSSISIWVAKAL